MHYLLKELRDLLGDKTWHKVINQMPKYYAFLGDQIWSLAISTIKADTRMSRKDRMLDINYYKSGSVQQALVSILGLEDEIKKLRHEKDIPPRMISETLEALLGAVWYNKHVVPVDWVRKLLVAYEFEKDAPPDNPSKYTFMQEKISARFPDSRIECERVGTTLKYKAQLISAQEVVLYEIVRAGYSEAVLALRKHIIDDLE